MRLVVALLVLLPLAACRKPEPPAPTRPPGEVYGAPEGQYMFVKPPGWRTLVMPHAADPTLEGATSMVGWHLNVDTARAHSLLTLWTFPPEAWATQAGATPPVGEVIFEDARRVVVATLADANPYPAGSEGAARFEALRLPLDSVRARLIVR